MVLICISKMISDTEHVFMYLLAHLYVFFGKNICSVALPIYLFIYLFFIFIFGCVGSLLLCMGFLWLRRAEATLHCSVQASHYSGFSCCGARALGMWASVVVAHRLSI